MSGSYPDNWASIAQGVKVAAGWKCVRCRHQHDTESGHVLTVHHLDMNKANCEWWNLAALCQRCHLKIQARVDMKQGFLFGHTEWMQPFIAGREKAKLHA